MLQRIYNKVSLIVIVVLILFFIYLNNHISNLQYAKLNKQAVEDMIQKYKTKIEIKNNRVKIVYKDRVIEKYLPPEGGLVYEEDKTTGETKLDIKTWGTTNRFGFQASFFPVGVGFTYKLFFFQRFGIGLGVATFPQFTENTTYQNLLLGTSFGSWISYKVGNTTEGLLGYRVGMNNRMGLYGGLKWDW